MGKTERQMKNYLKILGLSFIISFVLYMWLVPPINWLVYLNQPIPTSIAQLAIVVEVAISISLPIFAILEVKKI